jgi:hypothetical protein
MLIRIKGGRGGILEYLVHGKKRGRKETRNELDERVVLHGDMDFTDQIIREIGGTVEKYLHITLSFKEAHVSLELLKNIIEEFEDFFFTAYRNDEYMFYAEAHLPKLKSSKKRKTGETIARKPHIHIVIPQKNLLTWKNLNPIGLVRHNLKYIEAFQEFVNDKYKLQSPKLNRRLELQSLHTIISRNSGKDFSNDAVALREEVRSKIEDQTIDSYDDLIQYLDSLGLVKFRNQGRSNEYINLHRDGDRKGINFRNYVFTRQYFEDKEKGISADTEKSAFTIERKNNLNWWYLCRSFAIKYLNSGKRKEWQAFQNMLAQDQIDYIKDIHNKYLKRYPERVNLTQSEVHVQPSDILTDLSFNISPTNSVIRQRILENEHRSAVKKLPVERLAYQIDPHSLINQLAKTHSINPEYYLSNLDVDSFLIEGNRFNCFWLLTEHFYMKPDEAQDYISKLSSAVSYQNSRRIGNTDLWKTFIEQEAVFRKSIARVLRALDEAGVGKPANLEKSSRTVGNQGGIPNRQAVYAISHIKKQKAEIENLLSQFELYKSWLIANASAGHDTSLKELWDIQSFLRKAELKENAISDPEGNFDNYPKVPDDHTEFEINSLGEVIYKENDKPLYKDSGKRIVMMSKEKSAIEKALLFSNARFGKRIRVIGSDRFVEAFKKSLTKTGLSLDVDYVIRNRFRGSR